MKALFSFRIIGGETFESLLSNFSRTFATSLRTNGKGGATRADSTAAATLGRPVVAAAVASVPVERPLPLVRSELNQWRHLGYNLEGRHPKEKIVWLNLQRTVNKRGRTGEKVRGDTL